MLNFLKTKIFGRLPGRPGRSKPGASVRKPPGLARGTESISLLMEHSSKVLAQALETAGRLRPAGGRLLRKLPLPQLPPPDIWLSIQKTLDRAQSLMPDLKIPAEIHLLVQSLSRAVPLLTQWDQRLEQAKNTAGILYLEATVQLIQALEKLTDLLPAEADVRLQIQKLLQVFQPALNSSRPEPAKTGLAASGEDFQAADAPDPVRPAPAKTGIAAYGEVFQAADAPDPARPEPAKTGIAAYGEVFQAADAPDPARPEPAKT
ncbi:MAG: hypothetical protein LBK52_02815, partial [Deltaproteobacteria bacterium]|nr:hypothetical protein [Deltaproteobacteria bacterium]